MDSDEKTGLPAPDAYTIPEFCMRHRISKSKYYQLSDELKPRTFRPGPHSRPLISKEAARDWRKLMEERTSD